MTPVGHSPRGASRSCFCILSLANQSTSSTGISDIWSSVTLRSWNAKRIRRGGTPPNPTVFVTRISVRPSRAMGHCSGARAILQFTPKRTSSNLLTETPSRLTCSKNWVHSTTSRGILSARSLPAMLGDRHRGPLPIVLRHPHVGKKDCLVGDDLACSGALPTREVVSEIAELRRVIVPETFYYSLH